MASNPKPGAVPAHRISERRLIGIWAAMTGGSLQLACLYLKSSQDGEAEQQLRTQASSRRDHGGDRRGGGFFGMDEATRWRRGYRASRDRRPPGYRQHHLYQRQD